MLCYGGVVLWKTELAVDAPATAEYASLGGEEKSVITSSLDLNNRLFVTLASFGCVLPQLSSA